ncbi:MAG: hypothetical protein ABL983_09455 [Nitrospira sp.]
MTSQYRKSQLIREGHIWERTIKRHGFVSSAEAKSLLGITLRHLYRLIGKRLFPIRRNRRLFFRVSEIIQIKRRKQVRIRNSRGAKLRAGRG